MRESKIEKAVCDYAESKGFIRRKFTSPGRRDVPDDIFFGDNRLCFLIEFKATGQHPRPGQVREIALLRSKGHLVFVVDSVDYGKGVIDGFIM